MFMHIYQRSLIYFSAHPLLNSIAHVLAGFGIALLLQYYMPDSVFLNPIIAWICIGISIVIHIYSCIA
jgi:hypothetical protein